MKKYILYNQALRQFVIFPEDGFNSALKNSNQHWGYDWRPADYCDLRKYTGRVRAGYTPATMLD